MTCEQAELRMAELLAGEIAPEERAALEKHLLDCATCRGDFEFARAGARIEWADVSVPKEVIESTLASFREPAPVVRLLRWATAAAAVFGLAVLLIASSRSPKAPEPVVSAPPVRPPMLATMQDAAVGAMVCKDEDGRPVGELGLKSHEVAVEILDGIAKTTVEENFENHTNRRLEGTFNFPLPADASISRLALEVNGKIEEGTCLERERAREVFEGIVRRMQDPALLEWQPGGFFKCRVFPIEPRSTKRVIVAYTQALPCFQGKMSYVYPLASEKTRTHAPEEVRISVQARFSGPLAKIASPSHHLEVQRKNANEASMSFRAAHYRPNNDFVVTMEPGPEEVRVVSHKTDGEDGYFACFATPQGGGERTPAKHAFVLDLSASTSAPRLDVAKRLVRAMMERRIEGDRFEILAHHIDVERSGEVDLRAANTFMDRLRPIGGCDILRALQAAGDAEIIYIGKGAPSFGETEPSKILEAMKGRRIRTIAVGSDANVALLERLGGMMRISPNDEVAKRVAEIAATLGAPVLSDVKIDGADAVYDVVGVRDLFYGERLIVSGRYRGPAAKLTLSGRGYRRDVDVAFPAKEEGNNYVRRLWAQRKVADLLAKGPATKAEVTDLGVKYQIMTPYTSFLVLENEQMWKDHQLKREVQKQDEVLGKELPHHRDVKRKVAHLLELSYMAADQRKFDRVVKLCDEILTIDPRYPIALELKDHAEKSRHKEEYWSIWSQRLDALKRETDDDEEPKLPKAASMKMPSREEWAETSKRLTESVIKTEGAAADEPGPVGRLVADRKPEPKPVPVVVTPVVTPPPPIQPAKPPVPPPPAADPKPAPPVAKPDPIPALLEENKVIVEPVFDTLRQDRSAQMKQPMRWFGGGLNGDATEEELRRERRLAHMKPGTATEVLGGYDGFLALDPEVTRKEMEAVYADFPTIFTLTTNVTAPGAPITDALPMTIDGDQQVFVRQLEVQLAQIQGLTTMVDEHRSKLAKSLNEKSLAVTDLQYAREGVERLQQDMAELELKKIELAQAGDNVNTTPVKVPQTRVLQLKSIAPPSSYTAKIEEGKTLKGQPLGSPDPSLLARWQVYQIVQAQLTRDVNGRVLGAANYDPQTNVFVVRDTPEVLERISKVLEAVDRTAGSPKQADTLKEILLQCEATNKPPAVRVASQDGALVILDSGSATLSPGQIFAVTRDRKFVALIRIERVAFGQVEAKVLQNLAVGRILPGDVAVYVSDPKTYLSLLPSEVRMDLASRASQKVIRAKMGLKE